MSKSSPSLQWMRRHLKAPLTTLMLTSLSLWSVQVKGASLDWIGGSGNWDTATANWSGGVWNNGALDTAVFGGTAGTVSLTQPITAGGLFFQSSGYVIDGNTLTLTPAAGSNSPIIQVGAQGVFGHRATINSILAGNKGFTKSGNGTLVLTNNANSFSGDLAIKAGNLVITNPAQLGTGTTAISVTGIANTGNPGFSGSSLILAGPGTGAGMTLNREVSISGRGPGAANGSGGLVSVGNNTIAGNLVIGSGASEGRVVATHGITTVTGGVNLGSGAAQLFYGNGNWIISGQVTGSEFATDRLIKAGNVVSTTLWLQNDSNNFAQALRIDGGTVRVGTNGALGINTSTQSVDLNNGTLEVRTDSPADFLNREVFVRDGTTGGIFVGRAINSSFQPINQTVTFGQLRALNNNNTLNISGRNGYNISFVGLNGIIGTGGANNATINNNSNGLLTLNGDVWNQNDGTARTLNIGGNGDTLITGSVLAPASATHNLTKGGTGVLTIQGNASTYKGVTTINAGTLSINNVGALAQTSQINIGNATTTSGALTYTGGTATLAKNILLNTTTANVFINASGTGALTLTGTILNTVNGAHTLVLGGSNTDDNTVNTVIPINSTPASVTSLQKIGAGTWVLNPTASNTFTGSTTVSGGTLKLQESSSNFDILPDAGAVIFNVDAFTQAAGGNLEYKGADGSASTETVGALTMTAGGGTLRVTPGAGGSAALTFASLAAPAAGTSLNVIGADNSVVLTGVATSTATTLPGSGHIYINGADFARSNGGSLVTPVYGTDAGFVNAGAALTAASHNLVTADTSTGALTVSSVKMSGNVNVVQTGLLTVSTGGILQTGGAGTISGTGITTGGSADVVVRVNGSGDQLTLSAPITSTTTGGLTKSGAGTLVLSGANNQSGTVNVNEGTLKMNGTGLLGATNIGLNVRQGATFDLNGVNIGTAASGTNSVNAFNGAGIITNTGGAAASLRVGNNNGSGYFTGIIQDGSAPLSFVKAGSGTQSNTGVNTYTGATVIAGGTLAVTSLADIGQASGIGRGDSGNNAGSLIFNGGILQYTGTTGTIYQTTQTPGVSIDRLFTLAGNGTIDSSGSYGAPTLNRAANQATLIFNNYSPVAFSGTGTRTLTLQGDSTGDNQINLQLINNPNANEALSLTKTGGGLWILGNTNNTYTGTTSINAGALRAQDGTSLPTASNLFLNGGVFESSGTFSRGLGTGSGQFRFLASGNTGFSSGESKLTVDWTGLGTPVWGTTANFLGTGSLVLNSGTSLADVEVTGNFSLGSGDGAAASFPTVTTSNGGAGITITGGMTTAGLMVGQAVNIPGIPAGSIITSITGATTFNVSQNATASATVVGTITAGNGVREIVVNDNGTTNLDFATVSGVISGTAGLGKSGSGPLILGDANTYSGKTIIRQESVFASSIGADGVTSSSFGTNVGGGVIELGTPGVSSTTVNLMYVGPGETTTRQINLVGTNGTRRIDSSGSGPLILANVQNNTSGSAVTTGGHKTLELRGTNTDANTISSPLGDNGGSLRLIKGDGGVWILTGANTYTGGTRIDGGSLGVSSAGALGAVSTATGLTAAASSNTTTVTLATGTTANIVAGMNVSGPALGYGDIVNSITNSSSFVLNNARTLAAGSELVFGGLLISNGALFSTDPAGLVLSQPVIMNNNSTTVFAGTNDITLNGNVYRISGGNDITISNNLESGAELIVNGNLVNWESGTSRTYNFRGYGDSSWNGVIQNPWTGAQTTAVNIAIDSDALFTLGGTSPNTYSGTTTLTNGILVLGKAGALGTGQFAFNGGTLRTTISGGANVTNQVAINATPPKVDGTESITFSGGVTMGASRNLQNELSGSAKLIISSTITNSAASTLTIYGSGNTEISGNVGTGTGAQGLQLSGSGTLLLTGANTAIGTLTASRSTITLSGTSGGSWNAGAVAFNPGATLTLDNSGGNNSAGRLNDTAASLVTGGGGTLNFISHSGGSSELAGALTLNSVQSNITMSGGAGTLTFASVNFANSGSSLDLGTIANLGSTNKVIFTAAPTLVPASTGIASRVFIGGNDFATHGANGIVAFTNYNATSATNLNLAAATDTINVNAGMTNASITDNKTINALKISGSGLTVGGSAGTRLTLTAAAILNTGGNNSLNVPEVAFAGTQAFVQVASGTTLTLNGSLSGTNAWSKALPGTLVLNAPSYVTSTQNLLDGTLKLNAGLNTLFQNQQLNINIGATLDLNGNSQYIAQLSSNGSLPNTSGTITSTNGPAVLLTNMAGGANFGGVVDGPLTFARVNGNTLTLSTAQTYTGPTLMMGGTLTLENDATLLTTPSIDLNYATLALSNNSSLQTQNNNRIADSTPITLRSGTLSVTGRLSTAATEKFGVVTSDMGANTITASTGGGTFTSMDVTFDSLVRNPGSTVNFTGSTLGQQGNSGRIFFTTPLSVVGNGALGAWAIANSNDFAAYNTALGVGIVGTGGFAGYSSGFAAGNITELPGTVDTTTSLSGNTTTGMLKIAGNVTNNITFSGNSDVLNLQYGGLLRSNNVFDTSIGTTAVRGILTAGGSETSGTRELVIFNNATGSPTFGSGTINATTTVVTVGSTVGLRPGMTITNANFPAGTTVVSVDSNTQVTLSQPSTNATQQTSQTFTGGSYVNGTTTPSSNEITMNSTVGIAPGMTLTGTGIPAGTYVVSVDSATKVTLSQQATALGSGQTFTVGVSNMIVNSVIADNGLGNSVKMVKSGAGILNLSANNTYTGGTVISQGTVNLIGSGVVIPAGGITLTGGSLIMNTNAGQIHSGNAVTLNGSSTLTMVGANTLQSLAFNNNGGTTNPTVNTNGVLTLSGATPITVTSSNPLTVATIAGSLDIGTGTKTLNVPAIQVNGMTVSALSPTLNISAAILNTNMTLNKTGAGILQLSGQSFFNGGLNISAGGILISGSSTPSTGGAGITSGPLGTGSVTAAAGTTFLVDASRTIANDISFAGTPTFDSTVNSAATLTLNGSITGLSNGTANVQVSHPLMTVSLLGTIPNIASITSFNKTGLGTLIFNATGYTGNFNAPALGAPNAISLLHDGNTPNIGNGVVETIPLGSVTFATTGTSTVTVGRAGGTLPYGLAVNKIIAPSSINTALTNGLIVANNNGYGLAVSDSGALVGTPTFTVNTASNSNVTQGLYLNGALSGTGFIKAGAGTLVLGNAGNTFTGNISINQGVLSVSDNGQLGNTANLVQLNPQTGTATFRATEDITTTRVIQLSNTANTRAIEVAAGKTLQLNSAFDLNAGAGTAAALTKADLGTLALNASNATWTGVLTISQGAVSVLNSGALGTTAGNTVVSATGAALQIPAGVSLAEPLSLSGSGISNAGALQGTGTGTSTQSGAITLAAATTIGADLNNTLAITGGITGAQALTFAGNGTIRLATTALGAVSSVTKVGTGTTSLGVASTAFVGNLVVNRGTFLANGAGTIGGTGTVTINPSGTITLDNLVASGGNTNNRLGSRAVTFVGGNLNLIGGDAADTTETLGAPTFNRGLTTITVTAQTGRQANLVFNAAANNPVTAQNNGTANTGASVIFRPINIGTGVATISSSSGGFTYGGSSVGATGANTHGILPWALVDVGGTVQFATGNSAAAATAFTGAVRQLDTATEMSALNAAFAANVNQRLSANVNVTSTVAPNSITLESGGQVTISPQISLTLASGGILAKTGNAGISGGALVQINTALPFNIWTVGDLTISSVLHGGNGQSAGAFSLVKAGAATLTLASPLSTIPGLTDIGVNTLSGQISLNQGTLKLAGGKNTLQANNFITIESGATLDLNGTSQQVYGFANTSAVSGAGGIITNSAATTAHFITNQDNAGRNWAGNITGDVNFTRMGQNTLNIYSPQTYTGTTLLNGGTTTLRDDGALANTSAIAINYATLIADNATSTANSTVRINNTAPITLTGASLQVLGRAQTNSSEVLGAVSLAGGHSSLITNTGGTGINSLEVTIASLARTNDTATIRFNATGQLGSSARLFITANPTLTNNIIGPWAIVDREYASYSAAYGVGALNGNGFAGYSGSGLNGNPLPTDNIRLTATGTTTMLANTTAGTLTFGQQNAATVLNLGGNTLTLQTGGLLFGQGTDNVDFSITNGNLTSGVLNSPSDFYVTHANFSGTNRTVTINAGIIDNGTGAVRLIKTSGDTGVSILTLNGVNTYTGGTVVNQGTLNIGASSNIPLAANPATGLIIRGGNVTTNAPGAIAAGNVATLEGSSVLSFYGNNTIQGLVFNNNGGSTAPTVLTYSTLANAGSGANGVLTIGSGGIVATSSVVGQSGTATGPSVSSIGYTSSIDGRVDFGSSGNTITVATINANGTNDIAPLAAGFNLRGVVGSSGGFTKLGNGVLGIAAQSFFTGPVVVAAGGLRNSAVNGGSRFSALTLQSGTRLDLNGLTATWGSLSGSGTVFNSSQNATTLTVGFDNTSTSFSGQIVRFNDAVLNSVALTKVGTGTLSMTSAQSAATGSNGTLTVNNGTLAFSGSGAWFTGAATMASTFTVNSGGVLALDNSASNLNNRLGLQTAGTLNLQGGKLAISGNSAAATTNTITTFNVVNGGGRVELSPNASSALTLAVTSFNTGNGSGSLVIGGITGAASAAGVANMTVTNFNGVGTQGGGVNGSTTMTVRHDILGDATIGGLGTGFLVRDSVTSNLRALASNELAANIPLPLTTDVDPLTSGNQAAGTQNVGLSNTQAISVNSVANTLTISGTGVINSGLNATAFGNYGPGGGLLTFSLSNAAASLTLAGATGTINTGAFGSTTVGTTPYVHVLAGGTLNVNGAFAVGGTAGMLKADGGVLNFNNRAYFTGTTTVNNGALNLNSGFENTLAVVPGATTPSLSALNLNSSTSIVDLRGNNQAVGALSSINPLPGMGGSVINSGATPAVFTSSTQSTSSTFGGQIGGGTVASPVNADISLVRAGTNTLTLTNANTYTGATVIRGGTLQLRDSGSILNTSSISVNYGGLTNDNFGLNASGTPNPTRISASTPVTLLGGTITVVGAGATDNTLVINNLTLAGGGNSISVQPQINEGSTVKVTIGNLIRSTTNHNTINFNSFSQQNSSGGVSTMGSQGLSANGSIFLNQINGVAAPTSYVLTATTTAGSPLVTVPSTSGLVVGMAISGSGIPAGATIASIINGTSFTLNTGTGVTAVTNSAVNANIGLTNNLIGGWAVADGNTFATYVTGYGVASMGTTAQGIVSPTFTGTDVSATTLATGNYNDGSSRTLTTGVKPAYSWRMAPGATQNITPVSGTSLTFGVGVVTNSTSTINFLAVDATNTISGTGSDLYYYQNQGTSIINMAIVGSAALVTSGGGTVRLAPQFASNSYSGGTYVNGGTLSLQAYPGFVAIPGDLTINNATVSSAVPSSTVAANQFATTSNIIINGGGSFTLPNYTTGPTNTLASLSFDNQGGNGNPTFAFGTPTTLTSTVVLTAANAITANNDSVATTPFISTGAATLTALQFSNPAPVITTSGLSPNSLHIQVPITSAGGVLSKSGTGSLTLSGANTFTTGFNLNQGSLIFGVNSTGTAPSVTNGPVGTGTLTIAGGTSILSDGTVRTVGNATTVNGDFTFGGVTAGNGVTLSGAMNLGAAGRTMTVASPAVMATITGAITSTATGTALTKAGNGTLILSSASNNFGGGAVAVTGGILKNGVTNAIPASSPLSISAGAGYDLNGFNQTLNEISGSGFVTVSNNASQTLTVGGTASSSTFNGVLTDNRLAQASSALVLNKVGSGSLILTNVNTYNGTTTVTGGTLQIGTNASLTAVSGAGATSVLTGATLAGTGTIGGNASIAAGGILSPGDASAVVAVDQNGTLTVKGTLTTVAGGTVGGQIRLNLSSSVYSDPAFSSSGLSALAYYNTLSPAQKDAWNTVPSTGDHSYDHISVGGALTLTAGTTGAPTVLVTTTQDYGYGAIFNLFDWNMLTTRDSGSIGTFNPNSANDLLLPTLTNGLTWDTSLFTTAGIIVVVPEPSRMLLMLFALMALAYRRRR